MKGTSAEYAAARALPPAKSGGQGGKNVAVPATPEKLIGVETKCRMVAVTARPGNTGPVAYGMGNAVRATAGAEIGALLAAGGSVSLPVADVSLVWIDAKVAGEGVSFTYLK